MTMTTEERVTTAVAQAQSFADELDAREAPPSGEDLGRLKGYMQEIKTAQKAFEEEAEARGATADAKAFLATLGGGSVEPAVEFTTAGLPMDPQGKTLGEMFIDSPAYTDFKGRYAGRDGVIPNSLKGLQSSTFQADSKALLTGLSSTSGGAFVVNDRYGPTVDLIGERPLSIRSVCTTGSTQSDTVEYVRVTTKTNNAATVAEATSSAPGAISGATPGPYVVATASGQKPESALAFEVVSTTVRTLAHWIPLTKRAASDAGQVRMYVDAFLRYGLDEEEEDQLINGGGTGEDLLGILQTPGIQTVGSAGTDIDAIVDAIAAIQVTGRRRPNAIIVNPGDWYSTGFLTAKDTTGRYLVGDPRASIEQLNSLWGLRVIVTEAQTQNTALVGDFSQAVIWDREGVTLLVSDQHADFFTRNLLAVLAEKRLAFGILDPQAFCTVTAV